MSQTMNIKNKLHQQVVVERIAGIDWDRNGSSAPLVVEFDTTEVCNLACPGCISEDLVCNQTSFSDTRLMEIAKEMFGAGVKAVILIGGGEPLAHPAVGNFIEYLGEHDIHIGITTNGSFLDRYMELIGEYSEWTRVSVDAASSEMFGKLRPSKSGKNEFYHIIENMRKLAQVKKGKLGYSYLIRTESDGFGIESNIHEIYDAAVLARDIGCDYFEIKPSYCYEGGQPHALVKHSYERMAQARAEISLLDELETDKFKIVKAINLEASLKCVQQKQEKNYTRCPVAELRTLITPSGVYICPYWRGKSEYSYGDAHGTFFSDIWNSKRRREVMDFADPSVKCQFHCLRHESNIEILDMLHCNMKDIEIVPEYDRFI
ncbi:radical SAM protein [Lachnospiraceae bacterium 29-84]